MPFSDNYEIQTHNEFDFEGEDYRSLFEASNATVFQKPQWLTLIYKRLVSELQAKPLIISVRKRDTGQLCLLLPLLRTSYLGLACIEPADLGTADYNAIVYDPAFEDELLSDGQISNVLLSLLKPCHLVFFRKMLGDSKMLAHLLGKVTVGDMDSSGHAMPIWAPYDEWRTEILSNKLRTGLRRKHRKLVAIGEVSLRICKEEDDIKAVMKALQDQRRDRYSDDLFLEDSYFEFYSAVALEGVETGLSELSALYVGDDIIGIELGFIHDQCYHFILSGMQGGDYYKMSPGLQLIDYILDHRVALGDTRIDFTIGDEEYKSSFGAKPTRLRLMARPMTLLGRLALKTYMQGGPVKDFAKRLVAMARKK